MQSSSSTTIFAQINHGDEKLTNPIPADTATAAQADHKSSTPANSPDMKSQIVILNDNYNVAKMKADYDALRQYPESFVLAKIETAQKCAEIFYEDISHNTEGYYELTGGNLSKKCNTILRIAKTLSLCHKHEIFYRELNRDSIYISKISESETSLRFMPISWKRYAHDDIIKAERRLAWGMTQDFSSRSICYLAPELLIRPQRSCQSTSVKEINKNIFKPQLTEKSDVYTLGRLMYFIRYGAEPWSIEGYTRHEVIKALRDHKQPDPLLGPAAITVTATEKTLPPTQENELSAKAREDMKYDFLNNFMNELMLNCCEFDPNKRPVLNEVVSRLEKALNHVASITETVSTSVSTAPKYNMK